jgi:hypothetical protein
MNNLRLVLIKQTLLKVMKLGIREREKKRKKRTNYSADADDHLNDMSPWKEQKNIIYYGITRSNTSFFIFSSKKRNFIHSFKDSKLNENGMFLNVLYYPCNNRQTLVDPLD